MKNLNTNKRTSNNVKIQYNDQQQQKLPLLVDRESLAYNDNYQQRIQ